MTAPAQASLPELQDVLLSWQTVDQLFFDLSVQAHVQDILVKARDQAFAQPAPSDLAAARAALRHGLAVQIRYRHAGMDWCDSLICVPAGVRRVRIGHGIAPG
jgi:hypothetical protein